MPTQLLKSDPQRECSYFQIQQEKNNVFALNMCGLERAGEFRMRNWEEIQSIRSIQFLFMPLLVISISSGCIT